MRYLIINIFLLIIPCKSQTIAIDSLSLQYVYMEFHDDFNNLESKWHQFEQVCKNQKIENITSGYLISIYSCENPPVWQLAYPVDTVVSVIPPLRYGTKRFNLARKKYISTDFQNPVKEFQLQLKDKNFYQNGPTMIRWLDKLPNYQYRAEIMIPVDAYVSMNGVMYKIARLVISISTILCFLTGIMLLVNKNGNRKSKLIFSAFIIAFGLTFIDWIFGYFRFDLYLYFPHLFYLGEPFYILTIPLIFLYVLSVLRKDFHFNKRYYIHFIPFIIVLLLWIQKFYRLPAGIKRELYLSGNFFSYTEQMMGLILINLLLIGYILSALIIISSYKRKQKNERTAINFRQLYWLYSILYGFLFLSITGFLKHTFSHYLGLNSEILFTMRYTGFGIFVLMIVYFNFYHANLFFPVESQTNNIQKSSLSSVLFQDYKSRLIDYMDRHKPYLDSQITLSDLSNRIGIPQRSLSEVINKGFKMNFFEFINSYRIKEAKQLIRQSLDDKRTILEVLYEVGYNNKSVFNSVFKKLTGKTPTEYRAESIGYN